MIEGSGVGAWSLQNSDWWIRIRIREAQKHVDPMDPESDPDLQHCFFIAKNFTKLKITFFYKYLSIYTEKFLSQFTKNYRTL